MVGSDAGNLVFVLSAAVDSFAALGALVWVARGGWRVGRVAGASLAVATAFAVKGVLLARLGVTVPFGVLHILWLDLVVVAPLTAAAAFFLSGRASWAPAATAVLLAAVGVYASLVEPERLVVERTELPLPEAREGSRPVRVGVIADLQFQRLGKHEREAVDRLVAERPDVILLAGDLHQGSTASFERELPRLRSLLRRLSAPAGVYAVEGDVESPAEVRRAVAGTGLRLLLNEVHRVRVGDRRLTIGGIELDYRSVQARAVGERLERLSGRTDIRMLLAHRPDAVLGLSRDTRVDLVVAGHTHGGQLQLPFVGPPMIASRVPRRVGAGGLHELSGRHVYVSRGVGVERGQAPKLRLGAPPEVSLITLR